MCVCLKCSEVNLSRHDAVMQRSGQGNIVLLRRLEEIEGVLSGLWVEGLLHQLGLLLLEGFGDVQRTLQTQEELKRTA